MKQEQNCIAIVGLTAADLLLHYAIIGLFLLGRDWCPDV